jgi:hypothetical protein
MSYARRIVTPLLLAPLPLLALSMTTASIREANWGLGYVCVGGFDLLSLFCVLVIVQQFNRTRILFESGHLTWDDGPVLRTRVRMTYAEAATLTTRTSTSRNRRWLTFVFTRDGALKSLGTSIDEDARAGFVLNRIAAEIQRRAG